MDKKKVRMQVERILDENADRTLSIIVQGRTAGLSEAINRAASIAVGRRSITNAADLLPPPYKAQSSRKKQTPQASAANVQRLRHNGSVAIEPLEKAGFVLSSKLARRSDARGKMRPLPLSGSAAMEIDRDDLANLPSELPQALAVFSNRRVPVPPRLRAKSVSADVSGRTTHAWGLEACGALATWGAFDARGQGVRVAVLDTGVEATHPDLLGKVSKFAEFDAKGKIILEGVKHAWDADGHGTHVCGTIAGGKASGRWIGVAPECKLLVAKVLGKTGGTDEAVLRGLDWAVANGAEIINLSLGALSFDPDVLDTYSSTIIASRLAGIPVIAAIGNDGAQTSGSPGSDFFATAIGAIDVHDRVAAFSAGRTQVVTDSDSIDTKDLPLVYSKPDLGAPGVQVYSSIGKNRWDYLSGTSMASPHVAGAVALLLSRNAATKSGKAALLNLSGWERADALLQLLIGSVVDHGENGGDHRHGHGHLSVLRAYAQAVSLGYLPRG